MQGAGCGINRRLECSQRKCVSVAVVLLSPVLSVAVVLLSPALSVAVVMLSVEVLLLNATWLKVAGPPIPTLERAIMRVASIVIFVVVAATVKSAPIMAYVEIVDFVASEEWAGMITASAVIALVVEASEEWARMRLASVVIAVVVVVVAVERANMGLVSVIICVVLVWL